MKNVELVTKGLAHHGYAVFGTEDYSDVIGNSITGFLQLIEEPENVRKLWIGDPLQPEPDAGLIEKTRKDGVGDSKFFFHYRPSLIKAVRKNGAKVKEYANFIASLGLLYNEFEHISESIVKDLSKKYPQMHIWDKYESRDPKDRHVLRLLSYKLRKGILADRHDDKSFLSLHAADSRPGLVLGNATEPIITEPKKMHAFLGVRADLVSNYKFTAMSHRVISDDSDERRWSIVFFTHIDVLQGDDYVQKLSLQRKREYNSQYLQKEEVS